MSAQTIDAEAFNAFEASGWNERAGSYDRLFGSLTRRVIEPLLGAASVGAKTRVLDLATGPGYAAAASAARGATAVGVDVAGEMVALARRLHPRLEFVQASAERLPFADGSFDAVTMSFGLRNVADPDAALAELSRVTRVGGRLVVCEFSQPTWRPFRTVYSGYLMRALPAVARAVSSNPDAYVYLAESIRAWPDQQGLAARIAAAGWADVAWSDLSQGIVALHRARKPGG
jgi:demethylmenaquinone methyltransferase / 2-methoxy-6-polyprenyl-1,4-benzoquinol methylase